MKTEQAPDPRSLVDKCIQTDLTCEDIGCMEAAKAKKGSGEPNRTKVASVTWDQVRTIAEDKMQDLNAFTIESAMKMVAGTARSMGFTVKGESPF